MARLSYALPAIRAQPGKNSARSSDKIDKSRVMPPNKPPDETKNDKSHYRQTEALMRPHDTCL